MDEASTPTPRRGSGLGRMALIALVGFIAGAYYFLPEEGGPGPSNSSASLIPGAPVQQDRRQQVVNRPASMQGVHLVDFWAEWCGPCKIQDPIISRVAQQFGGQMRVSKVDVDSQAALAQQFGVQGVPTIIIFKDGQEAARFVGVTDESELRQTIAGLVR